MRNELWPVDLSDLDPTLKGIEHLSKEEIQKIVAEKFEYFSSLIKYSKNAWLKMKAYKAAPGKEWTFACGLGEEGNKYFQKFLEWKIKIENIPLEYFEPKYLYYWLPWLLTKANDVLWPIVDHELQHAESTDYGDIVWNTREAILHNIPTTVVWLFFNSFEDIYMWKKQIAKWRAKALWVLNLYRDMYPTSWEKDMRWYLKMDQFGMLAIYHRLKTEFPDDFKTKIIVADDVQMEFDEFSSHLDEITDISIPNKERIMKKNEILWPIIDILRQKDTEKLKKDKMREQIRQERQKQQEQEMEETTWRTKKDLQDNLWVESPEWWETSSQEWVPWESGNPEWAQNTGESSQWSGNPGWEQEMGESPQWSGNPGWEQETGESPQRSGNTEWIQEPIVWPQSPTDWETDGPDWPIDPELEKEVEKRLSEMSDEELEKFEEEIKKELDKKNIQEHQKELQVQKDLLEKSDSSMPDRLKDLFWSKEEREERRQEKESEREAQESQQKMQEQWDEIVEAVEQREKDLEQEERIKKILDKISEKTKEKDLKTMDELQEELEELQKTTETMNTEDIKKKVKEAVKSMKDYIKQQEVRYEKQLINSWFSREEEGLYKEYLKIEKAMKKYLKKFIEELEDVIPKLKEFNLEWWYSSWRVTDMNEAGRRIRLKQFGSKLYSRQEEAESMEINLWICLSIDMSGSMHKNIDDTKKLVVFLWLLCEKRWIPFHVNTFGDHLSIIKDTADGFVSRKWALMRELKANGGCTNIGVAVQKDLQVIEEVKKTHPNTVFLPIFITDWYANEWLRGEWLIELMKWFKWLSIMSGIWIDEWDLKAYYTDSNVIWLSDSSEIMTKLLKALKKFFKDHQKDIFKVISE